MTFTGIVVHGRKLGREIGFPTVNLKLTTALVNFKKGVYKVLVKHETKSYFGVMNIGYRPTVNEIQEGIVTIEIHILNFNKQIYGDSLDITPLLYIRDEKKFSSIEDLKSQIYQDIQIASQISLDSKRVSVDEQLIV